MQHKVTSYKRECQCSVGCREASWPLGGAGAGVTGLSGPVEHSRYRFYLGLSRAGSCDLFASLEPGGWLLWADEGVFQVAQRVQSSRKKRTPALGRNF